jgi:hypothetical protein
MKDLWSFVPLLIVVVLAFWDGSLVSLLADRHAMSLHHRQDVMEYASFIPVLFIMAGVRSDLASRG